TPGDPTRLYGTQVRYASNDGHFFIAEAGFDSGANKYSLGGWAYHSPAVTGNAGVYLLAQHSFNKVINAFARYGTAANVPNRFDQNISAGLTFSGLLADRSEDILGVAITSVRVGDHHMATQQAAGTPTDKEETTAEVTYTIQLAEDISVQPDLQYVMNPNVDPARENALVGAVRFRIGLEN
ncbi:MAG: carbohydrate porin, partial [Bdellovibrionota bacterium]